MAINGINAFLSLPVATQSLLSWSFLAFVVYFVSGFWTFKIGLAIFLLLFRPLSSTQLAFGAKKRSPRQRDAHGQLFSADPLVSALQVSLKVVAAACGRKHVADVAFIVSYPENPRHCLLQQRASIWIRQLTIDATLG